MEKKFVENRGNVYMHRGYAHRGWHNENKAAINRQLVKNIKDGHIVEIGVFGGASILSIIDICIENNNVITGIDPWELTIPKDGSNLSDLRFRKENLVDAYTNLTYIISELKYDSNIKLIKEFAHKVVDKLDDHTIDLLYIDGEHTYNAVKLDLNLWYPKIKQGGTIWGDDFNTAGVKRAVKEFCNDKKLQFVKSGSSFIINL